MRTTLRALAISATFALITTGTGWAQGHRGHGANPSNHTWRANESGHGDRDRDHDRDWRGDRNRWTFGNNGQPNGWSHGKKTGWGNCDVPPGQAKKLGCTSGWGMMGGSRRANREQRGWTRNQGRRYYNSRRDRDGDRDRDHDRR